MKLAHFLFSRRFASFIRYAVVLLILFSAAISAISNHRHRWAATLRVVTIVSRVEVMAVDTAGKLPSFFSLDSLPPHKADLQTFLPILRAELDIYSGQILNKFGLHRIVLCGALMLNGKRIAGVSDASEDTIYLSMNYININNLFAAKTIHHEIFHIIDYHNNEKNESDEAWRGLNAKGFQYGSGGFDLVEDSMALLPDDSVEGFLNKYSRSSVEEDKAEIFSHMIADPERVKARLPKDALIKSKCFAIERFILRCYPDMNNAFWQQNRRRPANPEG
jgi:Putative zinc-binding metallo-peptidase